MGTIGNQPERNPFRVGIKDLEMFIQDALDLSKEHKISLEDVIRAKHALELERQNNIAVQSGDYTDEHVGGIAEILNKAAYALESRD